MMLDEKKLWPLMKIYENMKKSCDIEKGKLFNIDLL